jgi:hypothetical protein
MGRVLKALLAAAVVGVALFFWIGANLERFVNRVEPVVLLGVSKPSESTTRASSSIFTQIPSCSVATCSLAATSDTSISPGSRRAEWGCRCSPR